MAGKKNEGKDVFDVANWLDRANGRVVTPAPAGDTGDTVATTVAYVPRHRADVPVDSVA